MRGSTKELLLLIVIITTQNYKWDNIKTKRIKAKKMNKLENKISVQFWETNKRERKYNNILSVILKDKNNIIILVEKNNNKNK
jgi:hypothetical protein